MTTVQAQRIWLILSHTYASRRALNNKQTLWSWGHHPFYITYSGKLNDSCSVIKREDYNDTSQTIAIIYYRLCTQTARRRLTLCSSFLPSRRRHHNLNKNSKTTAFRTFSKHTSVIQWCSRGLNVPHSRRNFKRLDLVDMWEGLALGFNGLSCNVWFQHH